MKNANATPQDIDVLLREEQMRDSAVRILREKLEKGNVADFEIVYGIVYKTNTEQKMCLYSLERMRNQLIRNCHFIFLTIILLMI